MCKKRKIITITVLFVLGVAVSYLQWGREIDVVGSMGTSSENFHEEHVRSEEHTSELQSHA